MEQLTNEFIVQKRRRRRRRKSAEATRPFSLGILLISNGKYLIVHATNLGEEYGWSFPKGEHHNDETEWDTAVRELEEETGIDLSTVRYEKTDLVIEWGTKRKDYKMFVVKALEDITALPLFCHSYFDYLETILPEVDQIIWVDLPTLREKISYVDLSALESLSASKLTDFLLAWQRSPSEFYHGTPTKENADSIISDGYLGQDYGGARLMSFLDDDLLIPVIFCFNPYDVDLFKRPKNFIEKIIPRTINNFGRYGYLFVIKIADLDENIKTRKMRSGMILPQDIDITVIKALGNVPVSECWQFDRNLADQLTPDCSNFFDLATLYWRRE